MVQIYLVGHHAQGRLEALVAFQGVKAPDGSGKEAPGRIDHLPGLFLLLMESVSMLHLRVHCEDVLSVPYCGSAGATKSLNISPFVRRWPMSWCFHMVSTCSPRYAAWLHVCWHIP